MLKLTSKTTWDATTDKEAFKNYAIAAATAGLTAGATAGLDKLTKGTVTAGNTATSPTLWQQAQTAIYESAISTVVSTATQSAINGDSFSDALESQAINIVAGAVGNVGAKRIGLAYKKENGISKTRQLLLHAGLGATTSAIAGNDPLSGAVSGVVGEVVDSKLKNAGVTKKTGSELAGLAGGLSSIFTGNAVGLDDNEIADSIFTGQRMSLSVKLCK